jgi:hypothetical protein
VLQRTSKVNAAAQAQQHSQHNRRRSSANSTNNTAAAAAATATATDSSSNRSSSNSCNGSCLSDELIGQFSQQWEAVKQREQFHLLSVEAAVDLVSSI